MKPPSQDRNAIKDHLDEATEYVVITNVKAGSEEEAPQSHMYINGRADRLVDLIAMIFDRHPNLFGLMMERHQPEFLQALDFIRATFEGEGESTSDETPETDETDETDAINILPKKKKPTPTRWKRCGACGPTSVYK